MLPAQHLFQPVGGAGGGPAAGGADRPHHRLVHRLTLLPLFPPLPPFPLNITESSKHDIRNREKYVVNFGRTSTYKNSTIPSCQRLLDSMDQDGRTRSHG